MLGIDFSHIGRGREGFSPGAQSFLPARGTAGGLKEECEVGKPGRRWLRLCGHLGVTGPGCRPFSGCFKEPLTQCSVSAVSSLFPQSELGWDGSWGFSLALRRKVWCWFGLPQGRNFINNLYYIISTCSHPQTLSLHFSQDKASLRSPGWP